MIICVEDEGVGFDVSSSESQTERLDGFGLFSVRERLLLFEGRVEIDSVRGKGTRVQLTVPLSFDGLT